MTFEVETFVSLAGLILAMISLGWQILDSLRERKPTANLSVRCEPFQVNGKRYLTVYASITNNGKRNLYIKKARLLIDEGVAGENGEIQFPYLWTWESGCKDCRLSIWCQADTELSYPRYPFGEGEMRERFLACVDLQYLTTGMEWIFPGETATETKIFALPRRGFYRATMVVIPQTIDCSCGSSVALVE